MFSTELFALEKSDDFKRYFIEISIKYWEKYFSISVNIKVWIQNQRRICIFYREQKCFIWK